VSDQRIDVLVRFSGLNAIALHMVFDCIDLAVNLIAHVLHKHEGTTPTFSFGFVVLHAHMHTHAIACCEPRTTC